MLNQFTSPVIVIGMHRSGTSLVSRLLHHSGINMGVDQEHNAESKPFLHVNQEVLGNKGYDWISVNQDHFSCTYTAEELYGYHLKLNSNYLKYGAFLSKLLLFFHGKRWGFKDPRSCFTLSMWLKLYPRAKVIFVTRRPEAVVDSLMRRNKVEGEVFDERLDHSDFCLNLWKKYNRAAFNQIQHLDAKRVLMVQYESMVTGKEDFDKIGKFLGLPIKKVKLHSDRAEHSLIPLDDESVELLKKMGYSI